jgi:NADPH:quinone reductase-like Zn-dependent oxidoreductase
MEAAGIVDEVGSSVPDRLKVGDAVMAIVVPNGERSWTSVVFCEH